MHRAAHLTPMEMHGNPSLPAQVVPLLDAWRGGLGDVLPGLVNGIYVHGSIAYGAWLPGASDADVLVLLARECTAAELAALGDLHRQLRARHGAPKLEVSYVTWDERGRHHGRLAPHPFHHDNVFHESGIFDFNSPRWSAVLWWQVAERSIVLAGPPRAALGISVTPAALAEESARLVETYWVDWTRSRAQVSGLRHTSHVDWVVHGVLRTWYTLRERDVTSKPGALAYGLTHLPARWHRLLRETAALREAAAGSRAAGARGGPNAVTRLRRAAEAALFMRYMVAECRRVAAGRPGA